MRLSHTARAATVVVALLTVFVAGCDEDDPPGSPPPSDSPSAPQSSSPSDPTTSPTETGAVEPTLPSEAEQTTKAGAKAFVAYYWEVVNYARHTGDVALLGTLSVDTCVGCIGGINSIKRIYDRGGRILGGRFTPITAIPGRTPSGSWHMSSRVRVDRSRTVGAGDLNQSVRPGELDFLFGLEHEDGSWRITFLDMT
jgi:hypothetical protein